MFFFQPFRRSKSNKNRLGQKFKIPVAYVFLYDHFASVHSFWCKSDESPRTSSRKCVKMPHFDLLFDLCDLDLGHMTLSFAPGRSVTPYQYILQVSRKSDDGKGAKRVSQQTDIYYALIIKPYKFYYNILIISVHAGSAVCNPGNLLKHCK